MGAYIARRLLISIPVLLGITIIVFTFTALAPGDPVDALIRPEFGNNEAMRNAIIAHYGLDQPLPVRYLRWLGGVFQGDFGFRILSGQAILGEISRAFTASFALMGTALILGMATGIPLGVLSAVRQYSKLDFVLTGVTFLGISVPSFLLGLGGLYLVGLQWDLVPIGGMTTIGQPFDFLDFLHHLALPAVILAFGYAAIFLRYTRASMLEVINADYVTTARSKGLPRRTVIGRHTFRNALIPIITIVGLSLPAMIGGAVVTEQVFSWPGLGQLLVDGVNERDYYLIMGITLLLAVVVLIANLLTDIAYGYADPRIRYS